LGRGRNTSRGIDIPRDVEKSGVQGLGRGFVASSVIGGDDDADRG
jgi:hypothetical protein